MSVIGSGVSLRGVPFPDFELVWNVSGTLTQADVGKAVTQDTAAASTVKLAGDGNPILGNLVSYENRVVEGIKIGTVAHKGCFKFEYTGTAPVVGDKVVGSATAGKVKTDNTNGSGRVVSVNTTAATVEVLFL